VSEIAPVLGVGHVLHDRYTIEEMIAQGGMSTIYRARDKNLPGAWAIKQMAPLQARPADLDSIRSQFKQEAEILARLRHPGIPRVIDFFTEENTDYLVEEFVPGVTLEHRIDELGRLTEYEATRIGLALLTILGYLHGNGIIYRDLKPGNVMLGEGDRVVLVDFGIARLYTPGKSADTVVVGTPGFASPEHYGRGQTDERSDLYSLGATLHQMLTGHDPADSPFSFEPPARALPGLSSGVSDVVMRALDLRPERRFASAQAMAEALVATRKSPPRDREFRYPAYIGMPRPLVTGGLTGTFVGGLLGTFVDPYSFLLFPAWLGLLGVGGVVRGFGMRRFRIALDDDGLRVREGGVESVVRWEEIDEIRIHRTSGIDRTLWGEVSVYPSSIDIVAGGVAIHFLPQLSGWEELIDWVSYRAGLRLEKGATEGADEVYRR
jgi:tRNA A-37 threonylcarbamoyl transferase component Bud32